MRGRAAAGAVVAVLAAGCSSPPDATALLESLTGDVGCVEDPIVRERSAACLTDSGGAVSVQVVESDPVLRIAVSLDQGEAGRLVWNADGGWLSTSPSAEAAAEVAAQLGGDVVTQEYFDRELLGQ